MKKRYIVDKKEFKKVIALVFIKGYDKFPGTDHKTELAGKIVKDSVFKYNPISSKSLLNYFNHFFWNGKESANPNKNTLECLLRFIGFQKKEQFIANQPLDESYLDNVPFSKIPKKDIKNPHKEKSVIQENNTSINEDNDIKQTNILSAFNFSIIKKINGRIRQLNIFGFGNKQEIIDDEDSITK